MTDHLPDVDQLPSKERIGFLAEYWTAKHKSHERWPEGQGLHAELLGLIYVHTIAALKNVVHQQDRIAELEQANIYLREQLADYDRRYMKERAASTTEAPR